MIEGCLKWQRDGLKVPPAVEGASREYRKESDVLGQWIDDCCDIDPTERAEQSRVYNSYRDCFTTSSSRWTVMPEWVSGSNSRWCFTM
jgi:phage/plasmid-associated DNA primase